MEWGKERIEAGDEKLGFVRGERERQTEKKEIEGNQNSFLFGFFWFSSPLSLVFLLSLFRPACCDIFFSFLPLMSGSQFLLPSFSLWSFAFRLFCIATMRANVESAGFLITDEAAMEGADEGASSTSSVRGIMSGSMADGG